ncbi:hypothetical protein OHB00_16030 [Streptomyces sp. NBC_00631]
MLTEAIAAAAAAGGTTVVQAASTDAWAWFRTRCARLLGHGDPERESEALDRLDRTAAVLDAADESERERVRGVHARLWQGEFGSLLETLGEADRDRLVAGLRELEREFGSDQGARGAVTGNVFNGNTVIQTGDHSSQTITFGNDG